MSWRFTLDDNSYCEGDVTLDQWDRLETELEKSWHRIDPRFSAKDAKAILCVLVTDRTGDDADAVRKRVAAMTTDEFLGMFKIVPDDLPEEYVDGIPH